MDRDTNNHVTSLPSYTELHFVVVYAKRPRESTGRIHSYCLQAKLLTRLPTNGMHSRHIYLGVQMLNIGRQLNAGTLLQLSEPSHIYQTPTHPLTNRERPRSLAQKGSLAQKASPRSYFLG